MKRDDLVWSDRKRNWLGLPWTFTVYGLTEDRLRECKGAAFTAGGAGEG